MMNVGLHHRGVDPQLRTVLQSELDRRPNHQVVDCFQRLWRQTDEAALEGIVFRDQRAVEVGELTQRQSIRNALAQLAIVPVLEPHQNQRAQDLRRRQSATAAARPLQAPHQIAPDTLDDVPLLIEKNGYRDPPQPPAFGGFILSGGAAPNDCPVGAASTFLIAEWVGQRSRLLNNWRTDARALRLHAAATLALSKGRPDSNSRITCTADHLPPRAAGIPRSFRPAAMARNDVAPPAWSSFTTGA